MVKKNNDDKVIKYKKKDGEQGENDSIYGGEGSSMTIQHKWKNKN